MNTNAIKRKAALVLDRIGINSLGHAAQKILFSPFVRVVNYHDIPTEHIGNFEKHLRFYSDRFANVDEKTLRSFLDDGIWKNSKPGLIISFDDGMLSHYERAVPLLEKYGFTGWFFVPAGWVAERISRNAELQEQIVDHKTLSLEQIHYLSANHVVGCHTETHCRLSNDLPLEKLHEEIVGAKRSFQEMLGREIKIFCWVGGEEFTYSKAASDLIRKHYDLGFMTNNAVLRSAGDPMQIQRTNIEAENPLPLVRFQLSGVMDLLYFPKRRRVNALTRRS